MASPPRRRLRQPLVGPRTPRVATRSPRVTPTTTATRSYLEDAVVGIHETCEMLLAAVAMGELTILTEPGLRGQFESLLALIHRVEDSVVELGLAEPVRALRVDTAGLGELIWPKQGALSSLRTGVLPQEGPKSAILQSLDHMYADMEDCLIALIRIERHTLGGKRKHRQRLKRLAASRILLENLKAGGAVRLPVSLRIANWLSSLQAWLSGKLAG